MSYKSASYIFDSHLQRANDAAANSERRLLPHAPTDMAAGNPNPNISRYYQTRTAHHGAVTSDWLAQARAAAVGITDGSIAENDASGAEWGNRGFSVVDEFNKWREQPELAEAVAAIWALTSLIRSSEATTMIELQIELKEACDSLKVRECCDLYLSSIFRLHHDVRVN